MSGLGLAAAFAQAGDDGLVVGEAAVPVQLGEVLDDPGDVVRGDRPVRVAGDLGMSVEKLVLAYGSSSGTERYYRFWRAGADAVISGEQSEWSCVRPAIDMELGVIELGHSNTERFGMGGMARYLREHFPDIPIEHIPTGDSFTYV